MPWSPVVGLALRSSANDQRPTVKFWFDGLWNRSSYFVGVSAFPSLAVDRSYNVVIRSSRLRALIGVWGPADGVRHKSIRTTRDGRSVHAIADDGGSLRAVPGQRYRVLHRWRRSHAENNRDYLRGTAAGQRDMPSIRSCCEACGRRNSAGTAVAQVTFAVFALVVRRPR